MQWPNEKDKQRAAKHYTENYRSRYTNSIKTRGELRFSGWVCSFCCNSDTGRVNVKQHQHHLIWTSCWAPVYINKYKAWIKHEPMSNRSSHFYVDLLYFLCHRQDFYWSFLWVTSIFTRSRNWLPWVNICVSRPCFFGVVRVILLSSLCVLYQMLPVCLDCSFLIVPTVLCNIYIQLLCD